MTDRRGRPASPWVSAALLLAVVLLVAGSWLFAQRSAGGEQVEFAGTDAVVTSMLEADGATPWASPLFQPGSAEVESGLFALQAALGAGLFGYALGRLHGRRRTSEE